MRKSGLHKKVAFIFEGAPTSDDTATDPAVVSAAAPTERKTRPDHKIPRPKPAPRSVDAQPGLLKKNDSLAAKKKNRTADADNARRQKTMTALVGVLSLVFIAVLSISFGGVGQSTKSASPNDDLAPARPVAYADPASWSFPPTLPEQMRNPLVVPKPKIILPDEPPQQEELAPDLTVRGIVYSENRPTAIIGDRVVMEGQTHDGVKILKISRNDVEFEKDGRRWTQRVQ